MSASVKDARIRIRAAFGTPEFDAEYQAAITDLSAQKEKNEPPRQERWLGSSSAIVRQVPGQTYRWQRGGNVRTFSDQSWIQPAISHSPRSRRRQLKRVAIVAPPRRHKRGISSTPCAACSVGRSRPSWLRSDPTAGVADPPRPKSDGFPAWTQDDIAAYEARWPIGTRERVWLDVLIYTGLRRGDAVRLGRQHVRNGVATLKTEKTGTVVTLPIIPVLAKTLAAGPCGDLTFICGERGNPLTKESFGNLFRKACKAAGLSQRSAHGLRKAAATRAADNGATEAQLEAIFGWTGGRMAAHYTRAANRKRLSLNSMHLLANDQ